MAVDESGWVDLNGRLERLHLSGEDRGRLLEALTSRLVAHFGADIVECHHGKNDPTRHAMREVAAAAIAHLGEAIDPVRTGDIISVAAPWDDSWRADERTASWRS